MHEAKTILRLQEIGKFRSNNFSTVREAIVMCHACDESDRPANMELKQLHIPKLHNLILDANQVGRWNMATYGTGHTNTTAAITKERALSGNECRTAFCAAGWGALEAGYAPVYARNNGRYGPYFLGEGYVPLGANGNLRSRNFDSDQLVTAHQISRDYYGLTSRESEFLFVTASDVRDVDRFLHMLNIVKDGNPSDFHWLSDILHGIVPSPKAERYNLPKKGKLSIK